jgi:cellulose synthase/poly-beta-1,6-N-acetylglucosamine synthase-like glycosyltransferase
MIPEIITTAAAVGLWLSLFTIAYVYAGYPLTLRLIGRRRPPATTVCELPSVTVVIAAYNEVAHIAATVRNKLAQDYPADLLDVIVVSDGSTDGTDAVVEAMGPRVRLLRQEPRQGKTLALNRAVAAARGAIVVFSDANSLYEPAAIQHLTAAFSDPSVGYVTGRLIYEDPGGTATGAGSGLYMRYENWLRQLETRVGSVVGVNGGIDAVRRELYSPMRAEHLPDFVLPLRIVAGGFRVTYCDEAVAHETALGWHADEFRMRVRVSLRALHALAATRGLLNPRHGLFAFQLFVHKVVRYLLIVPLAGALVCAGLLAVSPVYAAIFGLQLAAYALAALGWLSGGRTRARLVFVPFYFALVNLAAGAALAGFVRGQQQVVWTPRKGA